MPNSLSSTVSSSDLECRFSETCAILDLTFYQLTVCKSRGDFGLFWIQAHFSGTFWIILDSGTQSGEGFLRCWGGFSGSFRGEFSGSFRITEDSEIRSNIPLWSELSLFVVDLGNPVTAWGIMRHLDCIYVFC